jgi:hypothetical protein
MAIKDYLPFQRVDKDLTFSDKALAPEQVKGLSKAMKIASLALGFQGTNYYFNNRATFERPAYDFERLMQAVDTDSYVKQAMSKYKDLFWKEGWEIVSENPEAISYLHQRIDFMEIAMKRPFVEFLIEVSDQLFKFSNAFIVKARGDLSEYFPDKLTPMTGDLPVIGYYLIPTEQVRIFRDKHNRPKSYRQETDPLTYMPLEGNPTWTAEKVIHLHFDRKTGRAFGTPFLINVLDDVIALRQIEEDIQNLVHRELFPLYKYKIGTAEQPAEPEEITQAAIEIENLRAEGGLILPFRHDVEVIGSQGSALDASQYLNHFKERVAIGLGVAPHHLGMSMNGGNRSVTERLDVALYDRIKQMQKLFSEMIRLNIFNELLFEGGFDPISNPMESGESDRCYFKFKEIDVDTQVKKENHIVQKYVNNLITLEEARLGLGYDSDIDTSSMYAAIQGDIQVDIATATTKAQAKAQAANQPPDPKTADGQKSAPAGQRNLPSKRKGVGNAMRPTNQNGRKNSPDIKRYDNNFLTVIESLLDNEYTVIESDVEKDKDNV